jgi:CheY-like chemotaxis protein
MQPPKQIRIFVVEDNLIYQQLIAKELESITTDIHFFTTGESCLESLMEKPDIVVLDYNLDGVLTGLDTLKGVKLFNPNIYAVLFTTQPGLNTEENFSIYGKFDYVEKRETAFYHLKETISSCNMLSDEPSKVIALKKVSLLYHKTYEA